MHNLDNSLSKPRKSTRNENKQHAITTSSKLNSDFNSTQVVTQKREPNAAYMSHTEHTIMNSDIYSQFDPKSVNLIERTKKV